MLILDKFFLKYEGRTGGGGGGSNWPPQKKLPSKSPVLLRLKISYFCHYTTSNGMLYCPGNERKMTSNSNFKVYFSERPLNVAKTILFEFYVYSKV